MRRRIARHDGIAPVIDGRRNAGCEEVDGLALRARRDSLTRREHDVMALVVSACLDERGADELGICKIMAKAHRASPQTMQARSFGSLVNMAAKLGFAAT